MSVRSPEELKRLLIQHRLITPSQWSAVDAELVNDETVPDILSIMERRQILTNLQTQRILKGNVEGLVLGNYKLLYRNASGSFARVYRAATLDGTQTVALKLLRDRWAVDPEAVKGFHREARICQKFNHPNIVPIFDVGSSGKFHYFTMEFVEGGNLRDFMNIRKKLNPAEATQCIYEICAGLEYALTLGATHRDLKLTNVLMSSDGVAKLVDFGLAGAEGPEQVGTSDDVHRALEYASLENGTNARRNDPRSDLFFAGAMYYELLSGVPAWQRTKDREERKQLSRYTSTPPLNSVTDGIPEPIQAIVTKMMQVTPSNRYQTAGEVMADLQNVLVDMGKWKGEATQVGAAAPKKPATLLIVDSVKSRMKALREYFGRYKIRTRFRSHPSIAFEILKSDEPPDGLLILADNHAEETMELFPQMQAWGRQKKVPCLAVFPEEMQNVVDKKIRSSRFGSTAFQPATLREIRQHFQSILSEA